MDILRISPFIIVPAVVAIVGMLYVKKYKPTWIQPIMYIGLGIMLAFLGERLIVYLIDMSP